MKEPIPRAAATESALLSVEHNQLLIHIKVLSTYLASCSCFWVWEGVSIVFVATIDACEILLDQ